MFGNEFTCEDRNGTPISCSHEVWVKHICVHPEIIGQQGVVIRSPLSEYQDTHHADTRNIYKNLVLPAVGNTLLKVSIRYSKRYGKERGTIKTAYATDKVKKGEIWLWGQKPEN